MESIAGLLGRAAGCFTDYRQPEQIERRLQERFGGTLAAWPRVVSGFVTVAPIFGGRLLPQPGQRYAAVSNAKIKSRLALAETVLVHLKIASNKLRSIDDRQIGKEQFNTKNGLTECLNYSISLPPAKKGVQLQVPPHPTSIGKSFIRRCCLFARMNYCLKVAIRADQLALALNVKVPVYAPVEVANSDSFAAGEPVGFFSRKAYPLPAVGVPV
jgi:hypothetical protein